MIILKNKMQGVFLLIFLAGFMNIARGQVGIIDLKGKRSNAKSMQQIVKSLGYKPRIILKDDLANPMDLFYYDCIIMTHRNSMLFEKEYKALAEYVEDGGTLVLTGNAAYWMIVDVKDRKGKHKGIRGGGPFKAVTGAKIIHGIEGVIKEFKVVEKHPLTAGLPYEFGLETEPPYDINVPLSRLRMGCTLLKVDSAKSLIRVDSFRGKTDPETKRIKYDMKNLITTDFLTRQSYGEGKCIWLACRVVTMVSARYEKHILKVLNNIIKSSL